MEIILLTIRVLRLQIHWKSFYESWMLNKIITYILLMKRMRTARAETNDEKRPGKQSDLFLSGEMVLDFTKWLINLQKSRFIFLEDLS